MSRDSFYQVPDVPVADLLLDTFNPRIRHGQDQNDCIHRLLRDRANFINLCKDIATRGLTPEHILVSKGETLSQPVTGFQVFSVHSILDVALIRPPF